MKNHKKKPLNSRAKIHRASSADILPLLKTKGWEPAARPEIPKKWARYYTRLLSLREDLMIQRGKLAQDAAEGKPSHSMHIGDSGTDSFDRDFALSLLSSEQDALYAIEEALRRIEDGSYGVCELTGKPIPRERLEAIPWARFSVGAQKQLEQDGTLRQAHFGAFKSVSEAGESQNESEESEENESE